PSRLAAMLARGALWRLTADGPKTTPHDFPQLARLAQRALPIRSASHTSAARTLWRARAVALHARRSMATTAAAAKPTATVKKAVKAKAATTAASKTATKKTASATKARPRAAAKKTTAKKSTAKKAAPKKKAVAKRVKKPLTEEAKLKVEIAALRKTALKVPVSRASLSGYNAYIQEHSPKGSGHESAVIRGNIAALAKSFKELTPAEVEHYNHLAIQKTAAKRAEYKAWVESYTPDEIRLANNARRLLRKKLVNTRKGGRPSHTDPLVDERVPKKPSSAYVKFSADRFASGDFKGISIAESAKLIASEWKALRTDEKEKYKSSYAADRKRFDSVQPATAAA
ncbi:hypothetical protein T440DRAFT_383814, partial [Plenodomus tracheiphilus IPT5]